MFWVVATVAIMEKWIDITSLTQPPGVSTGGCIASFDGTSIGVTVGVITFNTDAMIILIRSGGA